VNESLSHRQGCVKFKVKRILTSIFLFRIMIPRIEYASQPTLQAESNGLMPLQCCCNSPADMDLSEYLFIGPNAPPSPRVCSYLEHGRVG
jgi:hypothetical protein